MYDMSMHEFIMHQDGHRFRITPEGGGGSTDFHVPHRATCQPPPFHIIINEWSVN